MTTIAWDGEVLAADRGSWIGSTRTEVRKVYRMRRDERRFLVAFCGPHQFAEAVRLWMCGYGAAPDSREFDAAPEGCVAVVVDERHRVFELGARLVYLPCRGRVYARGAGADVAWGALDAGANAKRAVQIAARRTDNAAFGVDCVRF